MLNDCHACSTKSLWEARVGERGQWFRLLTMSGKNVQIFAKETY